MGISNENIQDLVLTVTKVSEDIQKLTNELRELTLNKYEDYIYDCKVFNELQHSQILKGIEQGLNVSLYAVPEFSDLKMAAIRLALNDGVSFSKEDLSVSYDLSQLFQIIRYRRSFPNGNAHFSPDLPADKISIYITALENNVDIMPYINEFDSNQLGLILDCLINNYDVNKLAISGLSFEQMQVIYKGLDRNIDVTQYNDINMSVDEMRIKYEDLLRGRETDGLLISYYCLTSESYSVYDNEFNDIRDALRFRDNNDGSLGVIISFVKNESDINYVVDYQILNIYKEINFKSLDDLFYEVSGLECNVDFLYDLKYLFRHSNSHINPEIEEKYFSSINNSSRNDIGGKRL